MHRLRRRRLWRPVVQVLLGLVIAAVAVGPPPASGAPAPATDRTWKVAAKLTLGGGPATSCPTTTTCWAIAGGELLSSPDGGASWSIRTDAVPDDVDALHDLDCPTARVCYVTARRDDLSTAVLVLRDGGVTTSPVSDTGVLWTISCPGPARCLTTDGTTVYVTSDGGGTWQARSGPLPSLGVPALSCVSGTGTCWAVGTYAGGPRVARTTNSAATWESQWVPGGVTTLAGVDCPSTEVCYAAGAFFQEPAVIATHDGGGTWVRQALPPASGQLRSMSCPTTEACWAFGAAYSRPVGFATADAGGSWAMLELGASGGLADVSCPAISVCAAAGSGGQAFRTSEAGWTSVTVPVALGGVTRLSCPRRHRCVGIARDALLRPLAVTSHDYGETWTRHALPPRTGYLTSLDCPSVSSCHAWAYVLVNGSWPVGQALSSTDGGVTWRLRQTPDLRGLGSMTLSCPTSETCLAVGAARSGPVVRATTDAGATWQPVAAPAGTSMLLGVSCASTTSCVLLGRTGEPGAETTSAYTTGDLGATYQQRALPSPAYLYRGLDCVGATCIAVGNDEGWRGLIAASSDGGASWTPRSAPRGASHLFEVSCGSPIACAVTGSNGSQSGDGGQLIGTTTSGNTWKTFPIPPTGVSWPSAVACANFWCLASDYGQTGYPRILIGPA